MNPFYRPIYSNSGTPFLHTWGLLANVDQFRWMVRGDMQHQLEMARRELGVEHIRAVGMLDDEMRVMGLNPADFGKPDAEPRYNWQILDYVIDTLSQLGLAPVFCTTFIPSALKGGEASVFTTRSHTSPPKEPTVWAALIRACVLHMVERHGVETVRSWYFEVWNEPNLMGPHAFWGGTKEDFFDFWNLTYRAIKSVDGDLRVGGPSTARAEWIDEFLDYCTDHDCIPDYIITHIYNNDSESAPLSPFQGAQSDKTSKSPNFARGVIKGVRELLNSRQFSGELHINEFGRSWLPFDSIRETAAEAAFIAKSISEISQDVDALAYWCLSDIYDQVGYGAETFHGNYGMLNLQGLRKPSYQAMLLLNRLGAIRLPHERPSDCGENQGMIVTTTGKGYQILIFHFDATPEGLEKGKEFYISLPPASTRGPLLIHCVDSQQNNILAEWRALGSPAYLSPQQKASLAEKNILRPDVSWSIAEPESKSPILSIRLEGSGIALIEIPFLNGHPARANVENAI